MADRASIYVTVQANGLFKLTGSSTGRQFGKGSMKDWMGATQGRSGMTRADEIGEFFDGVIRKEMPQGSSPSFSRGKVGRPRDRRRTGTTLDQGQQKPRMAWSGGKLVWTFENTAPHALWVHDGTSAHRIYPVNAKALAFPGSNVDRKRGRMVQSQERVTKNGKRSMRTVSRRQVNTQFSAAFAKWVNHPGSRANPFLTRALEKGYARVEDKLRTMVSINIRKYLQVD